MFGLPGPAPGGFALTEDRAPALVFERQSHSVVARNVMRHALPPYSVIGNPTKQ